VAESAELPCGKFILTEVRDPLTDEILFGRLEHGAPPPSGWKATR